MVLARTRFDPTHRRDLGKAGRTHRRSISLELGVRVRL